MSKDAVSNEVANLKRHLEELQLVLATQTKSAGLSDAGLQDVHERAAALSTIFTATAPVTGDDFFRSLVTQLASIMKVRYALVGEAMPGGGDRVRTRAFWANDGLVDNFEYDLTGTPCANVVNQQMSYYERGVQEVFPQDRLLAEMGVDSYCGTPLFDRGGLVLGLLVVMHDRPISIPFDVRQILTIFAARAGAELERQRTESTERERIQKLIAYQDALIGLAKNQALHGGDLEEACRAITETGSRTLQVGRSSIWVYTGERAGIQLMDLYEERTRQHSAGTVLRASEYPVYFRALDTEERAIAAHDALTDPRTNEYSSGYLCPLGIGAMLDAPIRVKGAVVGVVCQEHVGGPRTWTLEEQAFAGSLATMVSLAMEVSEHKRTEAKERASAELLAAISRIQYGFIAHAESPAVFDNLLAEVLHLTQSEYGFVAEVRRTQKGEPFLKCHAITNIAWNDETRALFERLAPNLEFYNLNTLFGAVVRTGRAVIANDPANDPRRGGLPAGHPPLNAFLGLPVYLGEELVGMIGLANRPEGYTEGDVEYLQPLLATYGNLIEGYRNNQRRKFAEIALREGVERFELAVHGSSDGLWDGRALPDEPWHSPKTPVWWSPRFKEMLGYREDEFPNLLETWAAHLHPDDKQRVFGALAAHIERRVPYDVEYRLLTKAKDYRWFRARGQAMWDDTGRPIRMAGSLTDITERKRLEEQLIHSQRMQAVGQLAGGIAHDFNNLLTVINGYSDMLGDSPLPVDTVRHAAREMKKAGSRAAALTHQLLAFSRKQILRPTTINVNAVVENLTRMLERVIGENIQLNTVLSPDLWSVEADAAQFEQVIMNLAVNARDAMPLGGRLIIETVNMDAVDVVRPRHGHVFGTIQSMPYVRLGVTDTGTGMDEMTQKRVFEPFFTTKEVGKGTGLGLSMVYGVVTQSGGFMEMASVPKKGSTFMVYLPRSEKTAEPSERVVRSSAGPSGTEKILLVEDEPIVRVFVRDLLANMGYQVLEAANGESALRACAENKTSIDLLITDVVMPGMTGRALADRIMEFHPGVCVLFISGYAPDSLLLQGLPGGQAWFLYKPFPPDTLLQKVREVLDKSRPSAGRQR